MECCGVVRLGEFRQTALEHVQPKRQQRHRLQSFQHIILYKYIRVELHSLDAFRRARNRYSERRHVIFGPVIIAVVYGAQRTDGRVGGCGVRGNSSSTPYEQCTPQSVAAIRKTRWSKQNFTRTILREPTFFILFHVQTS